MSLSTISGLVVLINSVNGLAQAFIKTSELINRVNSEGRNVTVADLVALRDENKAKLQSFNDEVDRMIAEEEAKQ